MGPTIYPPARTRRLRLRDIAPDDARLLTNYGSRLVHHKSCELVTLGADCVRELAAERVSLQRIDRLKRLAIVIGSHRLTVITARQPRGRRGRGHFNANAGDRP